jgi:hypothetical protein
VNDLLARYRRMRAWVASERRRVARTRERPSQRYLRRARLLIEVDDVTFRELARELRAFSGRGLGR